jgi:small subunit ribosomal protein S20
MPVIKSAKKKLKKDIKRTVENKKLKDLFRKAVKKAEKSPTESSVRKAVKLTDKAAKKNIIHKNKAARIKSKLAKLLGGKKQPVRPKIEAKKTPAKKPSNPKAKK